MAALFIAPLYILVNYYALRWILDWMGNCIKHFKSKAFKTIFITLYVFVSTTPLTCFLIKFPPVHRILKHISNIWFGIFLYTLFFIIIADLIRLLLKRTGILKQNSYHPKKVFILSGTITLTAIIAISAYGFLHARQLYTTPYNIEIDKSCGNHKSLKIALVADLHLGYSIGIWHMQQMVDRINEMDVDLVVMAGDIFDNEFDAIRYPSELEKILSGIQSTYGVFASYGNHDLDEAILAGFTFQTGNAQNDDSRMEQFFQNANITLLNDRAVLIDQSFYLIGRKDKSRSQKVEDGRKSPAQLVAGLDQEKPILVIDHQPKEYQELADSGVDLDLSGHTHDGQIFPGNILTSLMWENSHGYMKKDNMHTIVTSGLGVWGPNMRVATKSEVAIITLTFQ